MKSLPKNYDHKEAEPRWQQSWEKSGVYAWKDDQPRAMTFVMDTPPPTVSGVLHMGHIFSYTQADFVARYQRMSGKDVFYPMGFDDNGLPTERLVEKIKGKKASQYPSREDFINDCREVVQHAEDEFRNLFKSTALSVDWRQEYQTVSAEVRKLSQQSFLDLLSKGEAYRDFRPTYWDWVDQTAIAQAEIENKEMPGVMNEILFTLQDNTPLHIATTRPELLGACVAVMYHPEDPNAAQYKGKYAVTPLFGVKVPMIADEAVERDKGTGLVMCCTFGDDTDKEWARKYELPVRCILATDGKVKVSATDTDDENDAVSFPAGKDGKDQKSALNMQNCVDFVVTKAVFRHIQGLKPKQANAKMLEMLTAEGALLNQTNITHTVKCAERSGTPIEIIPTYQWFVKVTDKKEALKAKGAECNWHPEFMRIRLDQWIEGLKEDWCISRQRFFGVPFPVWEVIDSKNNREIISAKPQNLPVDPLTDFPKDCGFKFLRAASVGIFDAINEKTGEEVKIVGATDVMDTWATSSLSPQINAGAITQALADVSPHPNPLPEGEGNVASFLAERKVKESGKEKPSPSGRGLGEGKRAQKPPVLPDILSYARDLRRNTTDAEQFMWSVLRGSRLDGFKFRRQHPIAPYIVDFFCHEAGLIIELDGGQHNEEPMQEKDAERTRFLESKGYKVLRFWNNEVLENIEGVFEVITQALADVSPHPNPLPEGEGILSAGDRYHKLFPADLRPQAHEIIRTWAFYTMVKAHLHADSIPWKNLMISGWCLAADKTKMSKSKGNVVTPVDLIRDKGADVVRYWASTSRLGADTAFSEDLLKIGKKLVTKLWNASNFVTSVLEGSGFRIQDSANPSLNPESRILITETLDKWILSRLHVTIAKATQEFERFEYCDARVAVEEFFWKDFCDNYLELVKGRAYGEIGNAQAQASAHITLYHCLNALLRLFAPFVPHVTDELYSHIFGDADSVHARGMWPKAAEYPADEVAEARGIACVGLLEVIRKAKSERNVSIKFPIKQLRLYAGMAKTIEPLIEDFKSAANILDVCWPKEEKPPVGPGGESVAYTIEFAEADLA